VPSIIWRIGSDNWGADYDPLRPEFGMPSSERLHRNEDLEGRVFLSEEDAQAAARLMRLLADAVGYAPKSEDSLGRPNDDELGSRAQYIGRSSDADEVSSLDGYTTKYRQPLDRISGTPTASGKAATPNRQAHRLRSPAAKGTPSYVKLSY
jgi:hypothetical protein